MLQIWYKFNLIYQITIFFFVRRVIVRYIFKKLESYFMVQGLKDLETRYIILYIIIIMLFIEILEDFPVCVLVTAHFCVVYLLFNISSFVLIWTAGGCECKVDGVAQVNIQQSFVFKVTVFVSSLSFF